MFIVNKLNKILNEALDNEILENNLDKCFVDHCSELGFLLDDIHKLKDGRIVYFNFIKEDNVNYKHSIEYKLQTNLINYRILKGDVTDTSTFENIKTKEDIDKAFIEIIKKFEGVE